MLSGMDAELRKQVALMLGQQAIEVVEKLLLVQARDEEIAQLRRDIIDVQDSRDELETKLRDARHDLADAVGDLAAIRSERDQLDDELRELRMDDDPREPVVREDDPAPDA